MRKKNIFIIVHIVAFLLLENLGANRIIWYYDLSNLEDVLFFALLAVNVIFDAIFMYLTIGKKEPLTGSEQKRLIVEAIIAGQFFLVLLFILSGNSDFQIIWPVLLAQVLTFGSRMIVYFTDRRRRKTGLR